MTDARASFPKKKWTRPELKRLRAGAAEDGANATPDAGIAPS